MSVTYKPVFRANPRMQDGSGKYYPQLIVWGKSATLDTLAEQMAYASSLTKGDIKSDKLHAQMFARLGACFGQRSADENALGIFKIHRILKPCLQGT